MKNGNLFHHEEQVLARVEELLLSPSSDARELLTSFSELAREYGKLYRQCKSLVNISDMMQKDLNTLNERVNEANDEIRLKNAQLEEYSQKLSVALESSQQKYRDIFDNAVEGIFRIAPGGEVLEANTAFARILGYESADELLAGPLDFRNRVLDKTVCDEIEAHITDQGAVSGRRIELRRSDGETIHCSISARAVYDRKGDMLYCEGLLADVTERQRMEQAERERQAAEAASLAKSRFLAKMSHEIRTPMNAVIGLAEIMLRGELPQQQREYMGMILDSGEHLLEIINDILDFAKLESRNIVLEKLNFNLTELLQGCMRTMQAAAANKSLSLTLHISPDAPTAVKGDPGRLRQVVNNLLSNAIKFTKRGVVAVSVATMEGAPSGGDAEHLLFSVKDTGIGIDPKDIEAIFQDFTQSEDSIFREYGGTGLGLSICRELVELMGGRIWAVSEKGKGSEFLFTARFDVADSRPVGATALPDIPQMSPLRVLMVEDSAANRMVTRLNLESLGHTVLEAENGSSALQTMASEDGIDLVLMDVEMPDINGIEVARRIRDREHEVRDPEVPIVAMTAHAFEEVRQQCLGSGMDGYLSKPLKRAELARVIAEAIARRDTLKHDPGGDADSLPVLDAEDARRNQGLLENEFAMLLPTAFSELQQELGQAARAIADNDAERLALSAHTMRTVAASIGALSFSARANSLECLAKSDRMDVAGDMLDKLRRDMERLRQQMAQSS